jgi:ATP-binding protein involved in chromosome partitioning
MSSPSESKILELLKTVKLPMARMDIVEAKQISRLEIREQSILIEVEVPEVSAMLQKSLNYQIEKAIKSEFQNANIVVELKVGASKVEDAAHSHSHAAPTPKQIPIKERVGAMIAVASGKGGVGKSSMTVNLAVAIQKLGYKVGILDCDVYGPSVPLMLHIEDQKPLMMDGRIQPVEAYGMKVMSAGFFVEPGQGIIWRGPMLHKLIQQFVNDVAWDGVDVLVVDLPPGTGDAPLSLSQTMPLTGAVMVSTPQAVSIIDVHKGISMFNQVKVPILGVIENMSHFVCPKCKHDEEIFDRGHVRAFCQELNLPYLGDIPIEPLLRAKSDEGRPFLLDHEDTPAGKAILQIAKRLQPFLRTADEATDSGVKLVV